MDHPEQREAKPSDAELEILMQEMVKSQLVLGENIISTSQFLRFVLTLANENLGAIQAQLEKIRNLADEIDDCDCAS